MNNITKTVWRLAILLVGGFTLFACTKQQTEEPSKLSLSETQPIHLPHTASETMVSVTASSGAWTAFPEKRLDPSDQKRRQARRQSLCQR